MINDLVPEVSTVKYVDDSNLWKVSNDDNCEQLQNAATYSADWSSENNLKINAPKTKELVINFGKKRKPLPPL